MDTIPDLEQVIRAFTCQEWRSSICKKCDYKFWDDHGDYPDWACDEERIKEEVLFYLKLYQYLIKEKENG